MATKAEIEATTRPTSRIDHPSASRWALCSSHNSLKPASAIAGSPSRNEKRAASSRLKPSQSAAVRVEPERDTPGISAPICAMPTVIASASDTSSMVREWRARSSAIASRTAITMQAQPITLRLRSGELQVFNTPASAKPAIPIGIVPSTIHTASRKYWSLKSRRASAASELTARWLTSFQK